MRSPSSSARSPKTGVSPTNSPTTSTTPKINGSCSPTPTTLAPGSRRTPASARSRSALSRRRGSGHDDHHRHHPTRCDQPELLKVLADGDAVKLRDLRALIDALVSGESPNGAGGGDLGAAAFTLSKEGELRWQPMGRGWR